MMTAAAGAQSGTALPAIVSAFSMLAVALFLANVAHEIQGFDQYMSCGHGNEREPKQFRFPPQLPCDFSSENHCNVPGESYPWQAVRRFVYENHGLMRRMYGDVRQGSILREEFVHHHPDDEMLDDDDQNDVPEHDVRHRYTHDRNINNVYSSSNDLGSSSEAASHPDHYQNQAETQRQQRHNARAPRHHRQRQFQFDTVGDGDNAWNQPYFGDVVAGVANDLDGGTRQRQPSVRRGRELSGQHHFTANHIPAFEEKEKVSGRDAAEEVQIIGDEIRFQGLLPTAQLEAIANVQYIHSTHHQRLQPGTGAKFSFGHQSHHSYYDQPNGDANEQQKTDQPNVSSTKEAPAMATTTGAPTVTTSSAPSSSQSPATSSMMPSATPAAVLMTADNRSDSDNGNKTSRPAEFNVSPQPTVTSNNSSDQSFTASSPASSSSPSVLESFERTDIWGDDDGDDVTGATERGTAGTERPSGTKRGSSTTRVTTSAAATTETASAAGMASLPNTEASSLVLEERKKSTSIPAASSVPLTTSTTDGDGTAPSAETMMSEDYYQQTSDIATEQPPPPKTTSQRPNNKYSKMKGINACPVKEEVVAPYWANNTRGEVLALLNLYPFEQYIHWEKCTYEHKQMYCRDGCRCEQQYRLHRLLAFDPNNECRGIFSDWFKFPSCCVCKCYDLPFLRPAGESADDEESAPSGEAMMSPRENPSAGGGEDGATLTSAATNEEEDDSRDLYSQRTPRFRNYLDAEIDFGPANIEPLDQADYLAYQLSQVQEEQLKLQQQQLELERGYHGGYSPDDRAVMDADEIVGPAYAYYEPGYPGNDLVEPKGGDEVVEVKDTNRFAYDGKYGKTNASAPLPLIRQPRGAKN